MFYLDLFCLLFSSDKNNLLGCVATLQYDLLYRLLLWNVQYINLSSIVLSLRLMEELAVNFKNKISYRYFLLGLVIYVKLEAVLRFFTRINLLFILSYCWKKNVCAVNGFIEKYINQVFYLCVCVSVCV